MSDDDAYLTHGEMLMELTEARREVVELAGEVERLREAVTTAEHDLVAVAELDRRASRADILVLKTALLEMRHRHGVTFDELGEDYTTPASQSWRYCAASEAETTMLKTALQALYDATNLTPGQRFVSEQPWIARWAEARALAGRLLNSNPNDHAPKGNG